MDTSAPVGRVKGTRPRPQSPRSVAAGSIAIEDTEVLEVSTGELDDVVRLEDRYGRVG
jgi:hypothetical protein